MKKFRVTTKTRAKQVLAMLLGVAMFMGCQDETTDLENLENSSELTVNNFLMVATGQTTLYDTDGNVVTGLNQGDALYGQDANYLKGQTMAYKDNGNGTVTDQNTGLMWQQVPTTDEFSWQEAVDYCNELELGGYDDWRMPSCKELYSISDFGSGWPYLNTGYFNLASGEVSKDEQYWSSNFYVGVTVEGGSKAAFGVNHVTGHIKAYAAEASGDIPAPDSGNTPPPGDGNGAPTGNPFAKYVRAVRGEDYGVNEFVDNTDHTITDNASGLMWAQDDSGKGLNWKDALAYCEESELAGYTDWRLPNVKELQGIVDYTRSPSATDAANVGAAIDPIFNCTPILNEAGNNDFGYYWTSTSANFTSGEPYYYAWYVAFGMAVNDEGLDFHGAGGVRFDTKHQDGPAAEGGERYYNFVRMVRDAN